MAIFLENLLILLPVRGLFWAIFLFGFCFFGIHILKLAQVGWSSTHKKEPPQEKEEEKKTPAPQEPVYYIVERKTRRAKPSYSEPKQIRFK